MIDSIANIFDGLNLSWIDSSSDIINSKPYLDLLSIFPNLQPIFQDGKKEDEVEFSRTINHIFRVFKIFFLIKEGKFFHETLSQNSMQQICEKLKDKNDQKDLIIPLILMYHDIGKLFNKKDHPHQSYLLISNKKLLESFDLSKIDKLLVTKIIQYHLLFATVYTGESTFFSVYSLFNDDEFIKLISNEKYRDSFVDLLEIFTYVDILGYPYAKIYDHYVKYYDEINHILKNLLKIMPDRNKALEKALDYSQNWLEWRIAGALRIFQFIGTEPYLTKEFFFEKLKQSIKDNDNKLIPDSDWETIKKKYLTQSCKIQIKYGLAFFMILAFGTFHRNPIEPDTKISYKLISFWILLSKEIASRSKRNEQILWNVYFIGLPHWSKWDKNVLKKLDDASLELIVKNASHNFDIDRKEFNLYLDFNQIFN